MRTSLKFVVCGIFALQGLQAVPGQQLVVFPKDQVISLPTGHYRLELCQGFCPVLESTAGVAVLSYKDVGRTVCATEGQQGIVYVSAGLPPRSQAKVLIHEVVHTAVDCDTRDIGLDEKIAQAIADLLDSPAGRFVEASR